MKSDLLVILIAPNVGEQMGGEAIKALQIFREIKRIHPRTIQITHERCRAELSGRLHLPDVHYVNDTFISVLLWKTKLFHMLLDPWFCRRAIRMAEHIAEGPRLVGNSIVIHQSLPNSPVMPRFVSDRHPNVFGPVNGNIYYPPIFRKYESLSASFRRIFHMKAQLINRLLFHGLRRANAVLYAGGARTRNSLVAAGCHEHILFDSVDCGIADSILNRKRIGHSGINLRFVHYGRLVFHKGTSLAIESLTKTTLPVCLDIVGSGPELDRCKELVATLGLEERVKFVDWFTSHQDLINNLSKYRGVVLPSIEDANGIVVQEAMALGLPPICLDWGGPQLLVEDKVSGYLVSPNSMSAITSDIAANLDRLAGDPALAESFSIAAKQRAETWRWSKVARAWFGMYEAIQCAIKQAAAVDVEPTLSI
jgi:glycosyltransferase involved in cell wall biosynthesis